MGSDVSNMAGRTIYQRISMRRKIVCGLACFSLILFSIFDLMVGPAWLTFAEVIQGLKLGPSGNSVNTAIVWTVRLPMTVTCICVGASLGLAGAQIQTILRNPLSSPYTLGISASAGFGAALAITTGFTIGGLSWLSIPVLSFIMAMLASSVIYFIGRIRGMSSNTMILAGIVLHFFFQAMLSLMQYKSTAEVAQQILHWTFGSLTKSTWVGVGVSCSILLFAIIATAKHVWQLTALSAGEERARSLGINTEALRFRIFTISALLTTGAVAFIGSVAFVGLVAPHCARMLVGEDQRYLLPTATIFGSTLMLISSTIAKLCIPGAIVPIGIVTSLVGVPFLFYLLLKRGGAEV